jgi:hypothetical protein
MCSKSLLSSMCSSLNALAPLFLMEDGIEFVQTFDAKSF